MSLKVCKVSDILKDLEDSIDERRPFSLIRFGDGGIKLIHSYYFRDNKQLYEICRKEGLPSDRVDYIIKLWARYANEADYIDCLDVYSSKHFWGKYKKGFVQASDKTLVRMRMWKELYSRAGFDIHKAKYCNPEVNYLMCVVFPGKKTILEIMKDKKICCITSCPQAMEKLSDYNIDVIEIVGHYEKHFTKSFSNVVSLIEGRANLYDFWIVGAGELGRVYSGLIKGKGGRTIDMGFVIDYWYNQELPARLKEFINPHPLDKLKLVLTKYGKPYAEHL